MTISIPEKPAYQQIIIDPILEKASQVLVSDTEVFILGCKNQAEEMQILGEAVTQLFVELLPHRNPGYFCIHQSDNQTVRLHSRAQDLPGWEVQLSGVKTDCESIELLKTTTHKLFVRQQELIMQKQAQSTPVDAYEPPQSAISSPVAGGGATAPHSFSQITAVAALPTQRKKPFKPQVRKLVTNKTRPYLRLAQEQARRAQSHSPIFDGPLSSKPSSRAGSPSPHQVSTAAPATRPTSLNVFTFSSANTPTKRPGSASPLALLRASSPEVNNTAAVRTPLENILREIP